MTVGRRVHELHKRFCVDEIPILIEPDELKKSVVINKEAYMGKNDSIW